MFTFFLFPGHFIHSPIVREERRYLHTARLPHRVKLPKIRTNERRARIIGQAGVGQ